MGPAHIVAAFDTPEVPTFRQERFPAYQAHRGPLGGDAADEFARQVTIAADLLPRLGIPAVSVPRYEADDVMGTLATAVAGRGDPAVLVSTDRDLLQLVGNGVEILVPSKGGQAIRTPEDARARIGVLPEAVTTFKALAGDASDNIPGLPGIGTKTAIRLIDDLGTLDAIYGRLDGVPARYRPVLEANRDAAYLYRDVATIRTDLQLPVDASSLPPLQINEDDRARAILDRHGYARPGDGE
jgi:DNA polymerase-1